MPQTLTPKRELWLLLTLAGIQFTHILDFMIRMPLGPQFTRLFAIADAHFATLVSAYTLAAGASGLFASTYIDRFGRKRRLLVPYCLVAVATLACGLAASYLALTARFFGRLTDRVGKVRTFRVSAVLVVFPLVATTPGWRPQWARARAWPRSGSRADSICTTRQPLGFRPVRLVATLPGPPEYRHSAPAPRRSSEKTGPGLRSGIAFVRRRVHSEIVVGISTPPTIGFSAACVLHVAFSTASATGGYP